MERRKPNEYWRNLDNVLKESNKIMKENNLDHFPTQGQLQKLGYSGLSNAISVYHNGFVRIRNLLGEELLRRYGLWKDFNYVKNDIKKIMRKHDLKEIPSQRQLIKLGYSATSKAIIYYHGGFRKLRMKMGGEQKRLEDGLWKKL
ncbi:MAG: hypothetical protein AABY07_07255, partial [Nanoarchaeota archaeon]